MPRIEPFLARTYLNACNTFPPRSSADGCLSKPTPTQSVILRISEEEVDGLVWKLTLAKQNQAGLRGWQNNRNKKGRSASGNAPQHPPAPSRKSLNACKPSPSRSSADGCLQNQAGLRGWQKNQNQSPTNRNKWQDDRIKYGKTIDISMGKTIETSIGRVLPATHLSIRLLLLPIGCPV